MKNLTANKVEKLRALAEKATAGPWTVESGNGQYPNIVCEGKGFDRYVIGDEGFYRGDGKDWDNANLVAALDPETVKALCDIALVSLYGARTALITAKEI